MAYHFKGFGQAPTDYNSYMALCMAGHTASCNPLDQVCIAQQVAVSDICGQDYVTDPNSPHNTTTPTAVPTPPDVSSITSLPQAQALATSEAQPTVAGDIPTSVVVSSAVPATTSSTVVSSSAVPSSTSNAVGQSSAVPTSSSSSSTAGFDLSAIPWWGWAAAAGVALVIFNQK